MVKKTKQIGTIVSDTGKLIICDPDYLVEWKEDKFVSKKQYKDKKTNKMYTYGVDFSNFKEILLDNRSVNNLLQGGRLERIKYKETNEFSNKSITEGIINKSYSQCNFEDNREGLAIAVGTLLGDGKFPVFAEFQEEQIAKIWIDFTVDIDAETEK